MRALYTFRFYLFPCCVVFLILMVVVGASGQPQSSPKPLFTWQGGDDVYNEGENDLPIGAPFFGTKGVASPANDPGVTQGAAKWKDAAGNLWLFTGNLWKFDVAVGQWIWVSGPGMVNQPAVYGTKGEASADNSPPAMEGALTTIDAQGNLWLYGGKEEGKDEADALWKYDISSGWWTWVAGSDQTNQRVVYGEQGVASPINTPGSRDDGYMWSDLTGNIWVFGGRVWRGSTPEFSNDLWKYDLSTGQWTWVGGSDLGSQPGVYGTKGVASPNNVPGARGGGAGWTDSAGVFWLYGGEGYDQNRILAYSSLEFKDLADLWKYDPATAQWTWVGGNADFNIPGIYGDKGVASAENKPGPRVRATRWTDPEGNLWLFGGIGYSFSRFYGSSTEEVLNDLWKFDIATGQWTWVGGSDLGSQPGVYGTKGVASPDNVPGARNGAAGWTDVQGNLWLFGGIGPGFYGSTQFFGSTQFLNDLWKYEVSIGQWTWISGSDNGNQKGVYGIRGVEDQLNVPGARKFCSSWSDADGNFWLYGGFGYDGYSSLTSSLNDLWKFNPVTGQWTWSGGEQFAKTPGYYGTKGTSSASSYPGARIHGSTFTDASGKRWMFGGSGIDKATGTGKLNDLWSEDPSTGVWTWVSGSDTKDQAGNYGTKGVPSPNNVPGARSDAFEWSDGSGNLWLFGGLGRDYAPGLFGGNLNDLWKFDAVTAQWIWVGGNNQRNKPGVYGTRGVADPLNLPGARSSGTMWKDASGNVWIFGGSGRDKNNFSGLLNDLWRLDAATGNWTWVGGSDQVNQPGVFGSKGVASDVNAPGARYGGAGWIDIQGNLWLFGGNGLAQSTTNGGLNDLWKFSPATGQWTWVSGSDQVDQRGVFGSKGVASDVNTPGARQDFTTWTDSNGNFWLFGGNYYYNPKNDLWKFEVSLGQWIWVSGSDQYGQAGVYGTKGVPSPDNFPGARFSGQSWTDSSGNVWLFGGTGIDKLGESGKLNDLWRYDGSSGQWTWMAGDDTVDPDKALYGTKGVASPENNPGRRQNAVSWKDAQGNFWLFGGSFSDDVSKDRTKNDLWKFEVSQGQWMWVSGSDQYGQAGVYGTKGVPSRENIPTARTGSTGWTDSNGNLWLFGGTVGVGLEVALNDLWQFNPSTGLWTWVGGSDQVNQPGVFGTKGVASPENIPGSRAYTINWTDASGNHWLFGGVALDKFGGYVFLNDLWKIDGLTGEWAWISGDVPPNLINYGTKGVASSGNNPAAMKRGGSTVWPDNNGNFWLFGYDIIRQITNDLWKFEVSQGQWIWVSGSDQVRQTGVYGTKGVASPENIPGARAGSTGWTDSNGNLWLFGGGRVLDENGIEFALNDVWKYDKASGQWTWIRGNNSSLNGTYGTKGVASVDNKPPARQNAVTWKDASGKFWMFGGVTTLLVFNEYGDIASSKEFVLNDLWKFDNASKEWTWVSGDKGSLNLIAFNYGTYGTKGVPSVDNVPPGRYGSASWIDEDGNLWLFGGSDLGMNDDGMNFRELGDLWKFNPVTSQWTWVGGINYSDPMEQITYPNGTKGVAVPDNLPIPRTESVSWSDGAGNLWLFGGRFGYAWLNDLWKYNLSTGLWTWVSGSLERNQPGVYGTKGVADAANLPGGVAGGIGWTDTTGNLWLFGGEGVDNFGDFGGFNSLWKYNLSSGLWTWVGGSDIVDQTPVYGTKGEAAPDNTPGARHGSISWMDASENLWLFGGSRISDILNIFLSSPSSEPPRNDLWKYQVSTGQWTWVGGSNSLSQSGTYGTINAVSAENVPGGRVDSQGWSDSDGNLWLFGGEGIDKFRNRGSLNDLWKISPTQIAVATPDGVSFTYGDGAAELVVTGIAGLPTTVTSSDEQVVKVVPKLEVVCVAEIEFGPGHRHFIVKVVGAGTATVTATINGTDYSSTQSFTVSKAELTVAADDKTRVYGDANPSFAITYSGFKNNDTASVLDEAATASTSATQASDAGSYPITVSGGADKNYTFSYTAGILNVAKATLTATGANASKVYGDANPSFAITYSGFKNNDTASVLDEAATASTSATQASDAGSYPITVSGGADKNYTFSYTAGILNVAKATLTATVANASKVYGDANPSFTVTYAGFKNSETASVLDKEPAVSTTAIATSDAGTYVITIAGGEDNNYSFSYVAGTLTVTKANQSITFTKPGDLQESSGTFSLSATSSAGLPVSFESADVTKVSISGSTLSIKGPGSVTVNAVQAGNINYNPAAPVSHTFCILPVKPVITASGLGTGNTVLTSSTVSNIQWYKDGQPMSNQTGAELLVDDGGIYRVRCTVEGCSTDSEDFSLIITGKVKEDDRVIGIYPNPAERELRLTLSRSELGGNLQAIIVDQTGRTVGTHAVSGRETVIGLEGLAPGLYFITVKGTGKLLYRKFIKQ